MKKLFFSSVAMLGLLATSCSSDEPMAPLADANSKIGFTVTADGGSRSTSSFGNGTDISELTVSAWLVAPNEDGKYELPGYGSPNTGNASFFTNDVLNRVAGQGTFNYATDARYWPQHNEILDFFAVVSNPAENPFSFKVDDYPGLEGTFKQGGIDDMPDMLFATAFDQKWDGTRKGQQNVSFKFDHAFAKVVVTAEVKNSNLRVCITDMSIHGILDEASFTMPYKSGSGPDVIFNNAFWTATTYDVAKPDGSVDKNQVPYTNIEGLLKDYNEENPAVLDLNETKKQVTLLSESAPNDLLVLPYGYSGRNSSKPQTYIKLMGYAYNISGDEYDADTDNLVYGTPSANGPVPAEMIIPIEFNWVMGTVNRYNIIFDCGNGGNVGEDKPNNPAFVRIGYEVEVNKWVEGQNKPNEEYKQ